MSAAGPVGWHPASRLVAVDGVTLHVVRTGPTGPVEGPPETVVLIHGFLVSSWAWRHNVDVLARRFDVVAPCQKGFGWSERPPGSYTLGDLGDHLVRLLDVLGVARAHLVGNSLGGAVALWVARHAPERVGRLVLVNPLAVTSALPPIPAAFKTPRLSPIFRFFVRPTVARVGLQALAYRGLSVDSDYLAGFREPFRDRRAVPTALQVSRHLDRAAEHLERELPAIEHPALVVWGTADLVLGARAGREVARRMAHARLVTFPDCGHCAHEEAPDRFNALVLDFLTAPG